MTCKSGKHPLLPTCYFTRMEDKSDAGNLDSFFDKRGYIITVEVSTEVQPKV